MFLALAGLLGIARVLAPTLLLYARAAGSGAAVALAESRMESLRVQPPPEPPWPDHAACLAAGVAPYVDEPRAGVSRRWCWQAGPAPGTAVLTVRVTRAGHMPVDLTTVVASW